MVARLKKVAPYAVAVVIAAVIAVLFVQITDDSGDTSGQTDEFVSMLPASEFLYLDGGKILTYLAELEGGERGPVHKIAKEVSELKGELGTDGASVSAISQHESSAESTLVRTEASELGLLLHALHTNELHGVSYHRVALGRPGSLDDLKEGELVRFVTHSLSAPGYIRPYVVVRDSATLGALFPRQLGSTASAEHAQTQRHRAKVFIDQIGPNPRITFLVSPPEGAEGIPTIVMPVNYAGLTTERSLLEKDRERHTGGRLVVFGKVDRVFRDEGNYPCRAGPPCSVYTDFATREVWKNPLEQASTYLIEHVSHSCKSLSGDQQMTGRECFISELGQQTELSSPGAVIVPIAILK
jgi:hypothetical protein